MPLRDPVAIYNAATNIELQMLRNAFEAEGIEAFATEDVSQVGTWVMGLMPEIHKPQLWVDRADIERAKPILDNYERQAAERRAADRQSAASSAQISVVCEDCGKTSTFAAALNGTIQDCPHCGSYIDVGDQTVGDWAGDDDEEQGRSGG